MKLHKQFIKDTIVFVVIEFFFMLLNIQMLERTDIVNILIVALPIFSLFFASIPLKAKVKALDSGNVKLAVYNIILCVSGLVAVESFMLCLYRNALDLFKTISAVIFLTSFFSMIGITCKIQNIETSKCLEEIEEHE